MGSICILVENNRFGLRKECEVLCGRFVSCGFSARVISPKDLSKQVIDNTSVYIIYHLSVRIIIKCLIIRASCFFKSSECRILWLNHEPHGFFHKLRNNTILYSLGTRLAEILMKTLASLTGTPNKISADEFGLEYLPLQYESPRALAIRSDILRAGYMGRKDSTRRFYDNKEVVSFPGLYGTSESAKRSFADDVAVILNIYSRPHAQSGVTPDALSMGLPVVVSEHDAWSKQDWGGLLVVLSDISLQAADNDLLIEIQEILRDRKFDASVFYKTFDEQFGESAFQHWLGVIRKII